MTVNLSSIEIILLHSELQEIFNEYIILTDQLRNKNNSLDDDTLKQLIEYVEDYETKSLKFSQVFNQYSSSEILNQKITKIYSSLLEEMKLIFDLIKIRSRL
jgi:hypothetical protein